MSASHDSHIPAAAFLVAPAYLQQIARMAGYSLMLAACTEDSPDFELLKTSEWEIADKFLNSKTDRICVLLMKPIIRVPRKPAISLKNFGSDS